MANPIIEWVAKAVGREAKGASPVYPVNPAPRIIQSKKFTLAASTSTSLATILGEAVNAEAGAVTIINNTAGTALSIREDGGPAVITDGDIGVAPLTLNGVKADFDDVRPFSADGPDVSVLVFALRTQA